MGTFSLKNAAKTNLHGIARFTEVRRGRQQRKHYLKEIDHPFKTLAESPMLDTACDYIDVGLRKHPYQNNVIY